MQYIPQRRHTIRRQFHQIWRAVCPVGTCAQPETHSAGCRDPKQIEHRHRRTLMRWKEYACQQHIDWQPRAARQIGCQKDGHASVPVAAQRARRHNSRCRTAKSHQKRNKRFARQSDPAQKIVHQKSRPRQISTFLQYGEAQKDQGNLRQKGKHTADAADHAVGRKPDPKT